MPRRRPRNVAVRSLIVTCIAAVLLCFAARSAHAGNCYGATLSKGQQKINQGNYQEAIQIFECVIQANPLTVDAYRGRIEAELLLGRFSDALRDYGRLTSAVVPVNPDAGEEILDSYDARIQANPWSVPALTGGAFARWWAFDYQGSLDLTSWLVYLYPNSVFGNLFRGSSRLFLPTNVSGGKADLNKAIQLAPYSKDVRFIVADAYTYAFSDPNRAFSEATLALQWGLDTPRIHAILAKANDELGNPSAAVYHLDRHLDLVTFDLHIISASLDPSETLTLDLVPGQTYEIPIPVVAGQPITIGTDDPTGVIWDTILVLYAPNGTPVVGSDDFVDYLAGLDGWIAPATGTYKLRVTSFEAISTGEIIVTRD